MANRTRPHLSRTPLAVVFGVWARLLVAAIAVAAIPVAAQAGTFSKRFVAENSPLGLGRNSAAIYVGVEAIQARRTHQENGGFLGELASDDAYATRGAATAGLRGRQLASEMTGNRIQRMAKAMREGTFDWKAAGPVRIAERDGTRIILDGHHRVAAARRAGLSEVPATVEQVSDGVWNTLVRQAAEALGR